MPVSGEIYWILLTERAECEATVERYLCCRRDLEVGA